ncbi:BEACH domain-containing protein [Tieghemostelium lacteum]|uniref:BEACH domain-containing protein n=1 Tax=Tieghemostelium lacteum TaxID=361077 RepID=A0A151Z7M5_TIELA|nr:BEACH domain-containing protein [Tieghemostelium lacteum]|eukprot:KYQ89935.1 BEACH domain-containing protein [Tieghemostelium lacteum]
MFTVNKPKLRFNLILMDEGEYYFDDYSATLYPPGLSEEESWYKRVKGRILVCSSSIFFEPDEMKLPIMKFPFREVSSIEKLQTSISPSQMSPTSRLLSNPNQQQSLLSSKADIFTIQTNQVIEMKENNNNKPYIFKKYNNLKFKFSLNYVALLPILENMKELLKFSRQEKTDHENVIKAIIEERESKLHFDLSLLVDINEKNILEVHCSKISPLVENPGRLLLTNERLYFMAMNNIEEKSNQEYHLSAISKILKRRHSLREIGLELFFSDQSSLFFKFKTGFLRNQVYDVLIQHLCPQAQNSLNEQKTHLLKWQNGVISNYEYLMYLNTLAGRTFNDLTQYPVFPWVVSDYTSLELDLNNPGTFRDLTKPMGALNPQRLATLVDRYNQMPSDQPRFLYGTHYSAPAYVLYYLVRQAPEYMLRLQNGRFDSPNRMFNSIEETWSSVCNSSSDVKELIPEFYKPDNPNNNQNDHELKCGEFLINSEKLDLGTRQDGKVINDIVLPPWANNSPEEFIATLRKALESEYVSQNLNHWIDLIFGYKQTGDEAVKANNLFYPLTYEGAVDIESISDPFERESLEAQINEFGQTPKQLFKNPHPPKLPQNLRNQNIVIDQFDDFSNSNNNSNNNNNSNISNSSEISNTNIELPNIGNNNTLEDQVTWGSLLNLKQVNNIKSHKDKISSLILSSKADIIYSVSHDSLLKIYSLKDQKQIRSLNLCNMALSSLQLSKDEKHIVIGSWDNHIYIYSVGNGSCSSSTSGHTDAVSCLKLWNSILVTGSWDSSVKIWRIQKIGNGIQVEKSPIADFIESESEIKSVEISPNGMLCVAGSNDGTLLFFDLISLSMVKRLHLFDDEITSIRFTPDGSRIIASSVDGNLKLIGIEGQEIFSFSLYQEVHCLDTDGSTLIIGCEDGIRLWSLTTGNELTSNYSTFLDSTKSEPISSIHVSMVNNRPMILTGSTNGNISIYQ